MESGIARDPRLAEDEEMSSPELHHDPAAASSRADDYMDQVLYDPDGEAFNLSSVDWTYVSYFYDYDTNSNNNNIIKNNTSLFELVPPERAISLAVFISILLVGFLANLVVVFRVVRHRAATRGANLYFLNISAADLLYFILCLPTISQSYALVDWRFGNSFCKLENYLISVTMLVNALTILVAGLHHFISITYPDKSRHFRSTGARACMLGCVWILSFALMVPRIFIFGQTPAYHHGGRVTLCDRSSAVRVRKIDAGVMFTLLYLLPLLVLTVCCSMIGRTLCQTTLESFASKSPLKTRDVRRRRANAKIIFAITTVFAIGYLPTHVYQLVEEFDYGNILFGEYIDRGTVALFITLGTKLFNPVFFCLFNRNFKSHAIKTCKCKNLRLRAVNHTFPEKSEEKVEEVCPRSVIVSLPVTLLPSRKDRPTPHQRISLAKSPSFSHLQPLLKKDVRFCASKCGSGLNGRPESWPCAAQEASLVQSVGACSCTSSAENAND